MAKEAKFEEDILKLEDKIQEELENCIEEKERKSINRKIERLRN